MGLVIGGFVAAILSTADELLNCCAYALLADCLVLPRDTNNATSARYIRSAKFYTGFFAFVAAILALLCQKAPHISDVFNVVAATQVVFFVPVLMALLRPQTSHRYWRTALIAMLLAFSTALISVVLGVLVGGTDGQALVDGGPLLALLLALAVLGVGWLRLRGRASQPSDTPKGA